MLDNSSEMLWKSTIVSVFASEDSVGADCCDQAERMSSPASPRPSSRSIRERADNIDESPAPRRDSCDGPSFEPLSELKFKLGTEVSVGDWLVG